MLVADEPRDMDHKSSKLPLGFAAAGVDPARIGGEAGDIDVARMGGDTGDMGWLVVPNKEVWFWFVYVG